MKITTSIAEIDVETLADRVRREMEEKAAGGQAPAVDETEGAPWEPPAADGERPPFEAAGDGLGPAAEVSYGDLASWDGERFVEAAYRAVLGRPADEEALAHYGRGLREGRLSKAELLARLRWSGEGRACGVRLRGLWGPLLLALPGRIPVVGRLWRALGALVRLPALWGRVAALESGLEGLVEERLPAMEGRLEEMASRESRLEGLVEERLPAMEGRVEEAAAELGRLREEARERREILDRFRRDLLDQERRLWRLLDREAQAGEPAAGAGDSGTAARERDHLLDALYSTLEDAFRGTRGEIKKRLEFYLPLVERALEAAPSRPVADLGCGRGEWLELLSERGISCVGVDLNRVMADRCRERGLAVVEGDALDYLDRCGPGSLAAVTAFQLVEHLPLDALVRLLDGAFRCLAPGGLLLLETPNPENLLVSGYTFYLDPTHKHPIPPETAVFLVEARGFRDPGIVRPPSPPLPEAEGLTEPLLKKLFLSERDYAVAAWKPGAKA
jgi:O-antigen chain-terminating methyltransferase